MTAFYLPIDWRRAHFFSLHPTVVPAMDDLAVFHAERSQFLDVARLSDVRVFRDWLHRVMCSGYQLLGCYERSLFKGIVIVFNNLFDLWLFRCRWMIG